MKVWSWVIEDSISSYFFSFHCHFYLSPRFKIWQSAVVCGSGQAPASTYVCRTEPHSSASASTLLWKSLPPPLQALSSVFFCLTQIDENPIRFTADFLPIFLIFSIPFLWLCCLLFWHLPIDPICNTYTQKWTWVVFRGF